MSCSFMETHTTLLIHSVKMCKKWHHFSLGCEFNSLVNSSYYYQYIFIAHDIHKNYIIKIINIHTLKHSLL